MEGRGSSVPISSRSSSEIAGRRNTAGGLLVWVSNGEGAVAGRGGVELVVDYNGVVVAGAGVQGLLECVAAGPAGIRSRIEDGGEGILAAIVCAAGTSKAVGGGTDEAVDGPRATPRCRRRNAGLEATVDDDGPGGASISNDRESKAPECGKHQRTTHHKCGINLRLWEIDALN